MDNNNNIQMAEGKLGRVVVLRLKPGTLIACINRRGKAIIPGGGDCIEAGDSVIVVSTADQAIQNLSDIFLD